MAGSCSPATRRISCRSSACAARIPDRRCRQPRLEARIRRQGPGVGATARQLFGRARGRGAREPELWHEEHRVHGAALVRLRSDAQGGAQPRRQTSGAALADQPAADLGDQLPGIAAQRGIDAALGRSSAGPVPGAVLARMPGHPRRRPARAGKATSPTCSGRTSRSCTSATATSPRRCCDLERKLAGDGVPLKPVALTPPARRRRRRHGWDHTGRLFPMYDAVPGTSYLVRPDGHVLGRWSTPTLPTWRRRFNTRCARERPGEDACPHRPTPSSTRPTRISARP